MKFTSAVKVGLTAILLTLVVIGITRGMGIKIPGFGSANIGKYKIYVTLDSVKGLAPGADVQLNGNRIGEVGEISNDGFGGVQVELFVDSSQIIHDHARITISRDSIFGAFLVSIDEPRSGRITSVQGNEATIRTDRATVAESGIVTMGGEAVGQIIGIQPYDDTSDAVRIRFADGFEINDTMAFLPIRPRGGGPAGLEIHKRLPQEATVAGTREPGPEDLIADADRALSEMTYQAGMIMNQLSVLLTNVGEIVDKDQIKKLLDTVTMETELIASTAARLTNRVDGILATNEPYLTQTLQNIEGLTAQANTLMGQISEFDSPELRAKIESITNNLDEATGTLSDVLSDVQSITSDPQVQDDIRGTVSEARATLEETRATIETARSVIGDATDTANILSGIESSGDFTFRYAPNSDRWVGDLSGEIGIENQNTFLTGGINDIGEDERISAQVGWHFNEEMDARVGIHRGKIGFGADWQNDPYGFYTNIYDPNDIQWDIYGRYAIIPELGVVVGVEDILGKNYANLGLRVQF